MAGSAPDPPSAARRQAVELGTAASLTVFGAIISAASLSHDIGWNASGPAAGYFPFRVGVLLALVGAALAVRQLRPRAEQVFATRDEIRRTFSVVWPTAALAAGTMLLGSYVASCVFLTFMVRRHGGYRWAAAAAVAAVSTGIFYLVFDLWFRVPLAKGPLEAALGL